MRITLSQLKKIKVETKSGQMLGYVYDVAFETEGQSVAQYFVKSSVVSMNIGLDKYLVSRNQVISIDDKKMIVEDNVEKIEAKIKIGNGSKRSGVGVEPVMMREQS